MSEFALAASIALTLASEFGEWQQWVVSYVAILGLGVVGRAMLWA